VALQDLGLSVFQERLYHLLLQDPTHLPSRLAQLIGADESEVGTALERLAELGVIRFGLAGIVVRQPALGLGKLIEQVEDELMSRYRRVSDLRSEVAALQAGFGAIHSTPDESRTVERVEGINAVRERIDELTFFARTSLYAIQPGGPQSREAIEASRPIDRRLARRKIAMRLINNKTVIEDEFNRAHLHELVALGVLVRVTESAVDRMLIIDNAVAVVPIAPGHSRQGALVVREPSLVAGLADLFARVWETSEEVSLDVNQDRVQMPADEVLLSVNDRKILLILQSGATDESAAHQLGVSARHLRRQISRILKVLGADSRFGAGAEAARRGLL